VAAYDVYVSDNGGAFQPWLTATTATTANYTGLAGHEYAFYSVATDRVGHREAAPAAADTHTAIIANPWHNSLNPYDVNGQGDVTPLDVLIIINYINSHPSLELPAPPAAPPPYYDVNDDGNVTALDVLLVINYINAHPQGSPEGETSRSALSPAAALAAASPSTDAPDDRSWAPWEDALQDVADDIDLAWQGNKASGRK
jgi:hypothetical protein